MAEWVRALAWAGDRTVSQPGSNCYEGVQVNVIIGGGGGYGSWVSKM